MLAGNLCLNHSKSPVEVWGNVTGWVDPVDTVSLKGGGTPLRFKRKAVGAARVF